MTTPLPGLFMGVAFGRALLCVAFGVAPSLSKGLAREATHSNARPAPNQTHQLIL
ncbi:hypothetical protein [uncultured Fibrella sp.]|uniref:hypothetical protein n=1 Tax=uncultured Fibrella sp. TaxID=1284596 RepID=UPI0035CAFF11